MKVCEVCSKEIEGRGTKYCSKKCCQSTVNAKHQNYVTQQDRGTERRLRLIRAKGGKCSCCSYSKNHSALQFHHLDPQEKLFSIDIRRCSNSKWEMLLNEAEKCVLLCANCHIELHNPSH